MIAPALLALACLAPPQDSAAADSPLARDPAELPRAEAGRWADWTPALALPEEHQPAMSEALGAYRLRDYAGTLAALYDLLEVEPDFPPALYQAATAHFRLRRYGDCALLLERFLEAVPGEVGATQALGHSLYSLGHYERARDHYQRVLAANPDSVEATRGLGLCHLRLGDNARALELFQRVVALRPDHAEAHAWIGHVHFDEGDLEAAREACERATELAPWLPRPWFLLSGIHAEEGDEDRAQAARDRFEALSKLQQELLATEAFLARDPRNASALKALVGLHVRREDPTSAKRTLQRLLSLHPDDLEAFLLALEALERLGETEQTRLIAFELEARFPDRVDAWKRLETYWASVGDITRQIQAGERHRRMESPLDSK